MARRVPACDRCGNEEDLLDWHDGRRYCGPCLVCPHGVIASYACPSCVRNLHTTVTAAGPRIRDIEVYVICARDEYGLSAVELRGWTYAEEEELQKYMLESLGTPLVVKPSAPAHHRLG